MEDEPKNKSLKAQLKLYREFLVDDMLFTLRYFIENKKDWMDETKDDNYLYFFGPKSFIRWNYEPLEPLDDGLDMRPIDDTEKLLNPYSYWDADNDYPEWQGYKMEPEPLAEWDMRNFLDNGLRPMIEKEFDGEPTMVKRTLLIANQLLTDNLALGRLKDVDKHECAETILVFVKLAINASRGEDENINPYKLARK